jgi:hypothetical protein
MPNQEYPSLNGVAPSWADISVSMTVHDGELIETADIAGINWSRTVEVGEQRGTSGGRPMKRTRGSVSYEAGMTVYADGYNRLIRGLKSAAEAKGYVRGNQVLISLVTFDVLIEYTPPGSDEIIRRKIKGCRLLGDSEDAAEGTDATQEELTLNPIEVVQIIDDVEIALI